MLPPYEYRPLEPGHIRLLCILDSSDPNEIKCSLVHESHDDAKQTYIALSYCWGDPAAVASICIDGRKINVARNLWAFLQQLRCGYNLPYKLWIDAICINQEDFDEKSIQVQLMWRIYEDAGWVFAWLGWCDESLRTALSVLEGLSDDGEEYGYPGMVKLSMEQLEDRIVRQHGQRVEEVLNDLARLTEHEYFERMWTYQEIVNSAGTNVCFVFGVRTCKWEDLNALWCAFVSIEGDDQWPKPAQGFLDVFLGWSTGYFARLELLIHSNGHTANPYGIIVEPGRALNNAMVTTRARQCRDPRDKIFAILGLPEVRLEADSIQLLADYSMTASELWVVVISRYERLRFEEIPRTPNDTAFKAVEAMFSFSTLVFRALRLEEVYLEPGDQFVWVRNKSLKDPTGHALSFPLSSGGEILVSESWYFNQSLNNIKDVWQRADGDWPWHGGWNKRNDCKESSATDTTTENEHLLERDPEGALE